MPITNEREKQFEYLFSDIHVGNITSDSRGMLYFIPGFYNGKIYVFEDDKIINILQSNKKFDKPYEYIFMKKRPKGPRPSKYPIMRTNRNGTYYLRINYLSGGINILKDGIIAHLLISFSKGKYEIGCELFSLDGSQYKYQKLREYELPHSMWFSNSGKWYLIDKENIPIVKEFSLKLKK